MTRSTAALLALLAAPAAGGPLGDALKARQAKLDPLLAASTGELSATQKKEIGDALAELIDFTAMSRAALGEAWEKRSEAERKDFVAAFSGLVRANSLRQVEVYRADAIEYLEETVEADRGSVRTTVKTRDAITDVVYGFEKVKGAWRVVDYAIDGVSAVKNYRAQFARILEKKDWATLVARLRKRQAEIEAGS